MTVQELAVWDLRMETAATLTLRKVLNHDNPIHQSIMQASQSPEEQEGRGGASAAVPSTVSAVGDSTRGLKRIKLEPTQLNRPVKQNLFPTAKRQRSLQQPDIIDLT